MTDALLVREMARRCNYNLAKITALREAIVSPGNVKQSPNELVKVLWSNYQQSGFLSARLLEVLTPESLYLVNTKVILELLDSLPKQPFEILTIHDCAKCLPNYTNDMRIQFNLVMFAIAESKLLEFMLRKLLNQPIEVTKDNSWNHLIKEANYAIC